MAVEPFGVRDGSGTGHQVGEGGRLLTLEGLGPNPYRDIGDARSEPSGLEGAAFTFADGKNPAHRIDALGHDVPP